MNRKIQEVTIRRFHYDGHEQFRTSLATSWQPIASGENSKTGTNRNPLRQMADNLLLGHLARGSHHILTMRPERKFVENPLCMRYL